MFNVTFPQARWAIFVSDFPSISNPGSVNEFLVHRHRYCRCIDLTDPADPKEICDAFYEPADDGNDAPVETDCHVDGCTDDATCKTEFLKLCQPCEVKIKIISGSFGKLCVW